MNLEEIKTKITKCFVCNEPLIWNLNKKNKFSSTCRSNCIWVTIDPNTYKILYLGIINSFNDSKNNYKIVLFKEKYFLVKDERDFFQLRIRNSNILKLPSSIEYIYDIKDLDLKSFFIDIINKFEKIKIFV